MCGFEGNTPKKNPAEHAVPERDASQKYPDISGNIHTPLTVL
jgi:hypothetical protein